MAGCPVFSASWEQHSLKCVCPNVKILLDQEEEEAELLILDACVLLSLQTAAGRSAALLLFIRVRPRQADRMHQTSSPLFFH